jgi:hypothetical protein
MDSNGFYAESEYEDDFDEDDFDFQTNEISKSYAIAPYRSGNAHVTIVPTTVCQMFIPYDVRSNFKEISNMHERMGHYESKVAALEKEVKMLRKLIYCMLALIVVVAAVVGSIARMGNSQVGNVTTNETRINGTGIATNSEKKDRDPVIPEIILPEITFLSHPKSLPQDKIKDYINKSPMGNADGGHVMVSHVGNRGIHGYLDKDLPEIKSKNTLVKPDMLVILAIVTGKTCDPKTLSNIQEIQQTLHKEPNNIKGVRVRGLMADNGIIYEPCKNHFPLF